MENIHKTRGERAAELFGGGCNCGQAVLAAFCEDYGLSTEAAMQLGCPLGGGFRSGELCGAAAASALVIGLKHGNRNLDELDKKQECYGIVKAYMQDFKELQGALTCRDILALRKLPPKNCGETVSKTVALLESQGY